MQRLNAGIKGPLVHNIVQGCLIDSAHIGERVDGKSRMRLTMIFECRLSIIIMFPAIKWSYGEV